jgi:ferric-dicitrate binding protein FerR (iron transport regulator)
MDAKIAKWFDDLVEGTLDAARLEELSRILHTDQTAADEFSQLLGIHFELAQRQAPVRAFSVEELRAIQAVDDRYDSHLAQQLATKATTKKLAWRRWTGPFVIAAMVVIGLSVLFLRGRDSTSKSPKDEVAVQIASEVDDGSVAQVRRKIDCDWSDDRWSVISSGRIAEGQLIRLTKGLLVLEFKSGAEITLNGPATFIATSGTSAKLVRGELSARVPPRARGFRVETHAGNFVDLGTEFGLLVGANGDIETHVFKGKVLAPTADGAGSSQTLLETGHAWARGPSGSIDTNITSAPGRFLLTLPEESFTSPALPPVDRSLSLWYSADSQVRLDADGGVSEWGDIAVRANSRRENAWQVSAERRPKLVAKSIGGKPALRFDGYKGLVTEPLKLGPSEASAIVFRVDGEVARELIQDRNEFRELGVQLLNLNGPPHTVLQVSEDLSLEARVHLGFVQGHVNPVDVGRVRMAKPLDSSPHVAVYSFDIERAQAQLYFDGQLVAETKDVPKLDATYATRYIGSHFNREGFGFTGDIAEVLIYDSALTANECQAISNWLGEKYNIPASGGDSSKHVWKRGD